MTYSELIALFETHFGITRPADIARELGVSPQAVSNWKSRDQIPYKYVMLVREKMNDSNDIDQKTSESHESDKSRNGSREFMAQQPFYPPYYEEDVISLKEIIDILKEHMILILAVPSVLCTLTIIYVLFIAQPIYTSSATIIPASGESSMSKMAGLASQFGISVPGGGGGTKMVYPEIIKSRTLSKKMLQKTFDTHTFGPGQTLLQLLTYQDEEPEFGPDTLEIYGMEAFIDAVSVNEDIKSSIITVSVDAFEPKLAADMAIALIEELDEHQKQFNMEQAAKKRIFIEDRIEEVQQDLEKAEEQLKEWRQRNRNIGDSPALLLEQERLMRETEVQKQLFITLKQEFEMAQIEEVEESDILHVLDYPEIPLNRSKPKRKLMVILAGFLGLGLGTAGAFVRNYFKEQENAA